MRIGQAQKLPVWFEISENVLTEYLALRKLTNDTNDDVNPMWKDNFIYKGHR